MKIEHDGTRIELNSKTQFVCTAHPHIRLYTTFDVFANHVRIQPCGECIKKAISNERH